MHRALRPYATAGLALLGAGVIAVSPLAPPPATTPAATTVSTAAVQLSAAVDPLTRWGQVITDTADNLGELGEYWMQNPMPITRQAITNVQTYAEWISTGVQQTIPTLQYWVDNQVVPAFELAGTQLQDGQIQKAVKTVTTVLAFSRLMFALMPMMDMLKIPTSIADHSAAVVKEIFSITTMTALFGGISNVLTKTADSLATSAQLTLDAVEAGDAVSALSAIANAPADAVNAVLNTPGGLFDFRVVGGCGCIVTGGTVLNLVIRKAEAIATAIALPAPVAPAAAATVAELPAATGSTTVAAPAPAPVTAAGGADATKAEAETPAAVNVSSTGATDLSAGNKAVPGKLGTTSTRPADRLRTSVQSAADRVGKGIHDAADGIQKGLKDLSDNVSKAGKKPEKKTASESSADSEGSDSDS